MVSSMNKIGVKPYQIDMSKEENVAGVMDFLKRRNSKMDEETIKMNSFILCNRYNDVWFQELALISVF